MQRHAVLNLVQCNCNLHCNVHVQLMVTRSEVVSELEKQGVDVADMEGQLCSMARDVVHAAQAQVINLASFHLCIFRASSGTAWCALSRCTCKGWAIFSCRYSFTQNWCLSARLGGGRAAGRCMDWMSCWPVDRMEDAAPSCWKSTSAQTSHRC